MATPKPKTPAPAKGNQPEYVTIKGKTMYARLFEPMGPPPMDAEQAPRWTVDILINATTKAQLADKGLKIKDSNAKFDAFVAENGLVEQGYDGSYVTVKKSTLRKKYNTELQEVVKDDMGQVVMEPAARPKVTDSHGNEIPEAANLKLGNGSDVEAVATVTKALMGRHGSYGARLVSTKILNLVEYAPAAQGTYVYGDATPAKAPSKAEKISEYEDNVESLDDSDIPF